MSKPPPAIHCRPGLGEQRAIRTLCQSNSFREVTSGTVVDDPRLVTCKRCVAILSAFPQVYAALVAAAREQA